MDNAYDVDSLHALIAEALGWTVAETQSFSLQALRDLVRPVSPKLAHEISECIRRCDHYFIPVKRKGAR